MELAENNKSTSRRSMRRQKNPTLSPMPSAVQRLFDTCKEVFADVRSGAVPSPADVERLRSVLGTVRVSIMGD